MTTVQELSALLVKWYREDDGIRDEMTWSEICRLDERYKELKTLGIDPWPSA